MTGNLTESEENAVKEFSKSLKSFSGNNIKQILLFGSKARGDSSKESDIDLFVLTGKVDPILKRQTSKIVGQLLLKYGVLVSPRLIPELRYQYQKRLQTGFIRNVERDGIKIE